MGLGLGGSVHELQAGQERVRAVCYAQSVMRSPEGVLWRAGPVVSNGPLGPARFGDSTRPNAAYSLGPNPVCAEIRFNMIYTFENRKFKFKIVRRAV